ncbi:MAG: hypothetical protein HOM16_05575 [Woeseia sp.]|jgi:hypothetical protein|nr:hypothetical protein [Woeseia sp.]
MRIRPSRKLQQSSCGAGSFCVQLHSRRASLVNEFCLNKRENDIADIDAAAELLRASLLPCDLGTTVVTLIEDKESDEQSILQFDSQSA